MTIVTSLATCLAAVLATHLPAQRTKPTSRPSKDLHNIKMDALSRTTLDRWEAIEYHPGRAGLKSVNFTVQVSSKSPLGNAEATGVYTFAGGKSTLKWDNARLGNMLASRGWSKQTFDRLFIGDSHRRALENTELTGKKNADGSTTLTVKGKTQGGYKSFTYDKDGVQSEFTIKVSDPTAGNVDAAIRIEYDRVAGKYIRKGWSYEMQLPMGRFQGKVTVTNLRIGKYRVYGKVVEKLSMGGEDFGTNVLTFSAYKLNGATGGVSKPKSGPNSKPTKKPGLRAIKQVKLKKAG